MAIPPTRAFWMGYYLRPRTKQAPKDLSHWLVGKEFLCEVRNAQRQRKGVAEMGTSVKSLSNLATREKDHGVANSVAGPPLLGAPTCERRDNGRGGPGGMIAGQRKAGRPLRRKRGEKQ